MKSLQERFNDAMEKAGLPVVRQSVEGQDFNVLVNQRDQEFLDLLKRSRVIPEPALPDGPDGPWNPDGVL